MARSSWHVRFVTFFFTHLCRNVCLVTLFLTRSSCHACRTDQHQRYVASDEGQPGVFLRPRVTREIRSHPTQNDQQHKERTNRSQEPSDGEFQRDSREPSVPWQNERTGLEPSSSISWGLDRPTWPSTTEMIPETGTREKMLGLNGTGENGINPNFGTCTMKSGISSQAQRQECHQETGQPGHKATMTGGRTNRLWHPKGKIQ